MPKAESAHAASVKDVRELEQAMLDFVEANALPIDLHARPTEPVPETMFQTTDVPRIVPNDILMRLTGFTEALRKNGMRKMMENAKMTYRAYESADGNTRAYLLFDRYGRVILCVRHYTEEPVSWFGLRVYDVTPMQCGAVLEIARLMSLRLAVV